MANKVRALLNEGKPTMGTHLMTTWPTIWELVGSTGQFDYIEFDSQGGAYDLHDLDNICRAAELTKTGTMMKIDGSSKAWLAERAIAAGFESILFADVNTAEEAKQCIEAVRITPEGTNGAKTTRGTPASDWVKRADEIVIAVMIERESLMHELDKVLRLDGLDMIQFGPVDYGLSLRTPKRTFNQAELKERIETANDRANEMAIEAGRRPRAEVTINTFEHYLQLGVRDFCIGSDIGILREWYEKNGKKFKEALAQT